MNKLLYQTIVSFICCALGQQVTENHSTGLIPDQDDALLMFSTLDGSLIAVEQKTGEIRWHQNDEPAVKVPDSSQISMPIFLPDPKDGSLYLFGPETEALKKLPFTIPQLVASSPCRSSDGILYTGRKVDTWFNVDPQTGDREQLLGFTKAENTCPLNIQNAIFVGRTEYNIIMIDSKRKDRKWNVTFYDYSAAKMDPEVVEDYDLAHFAASSTGQVVTIDRFGNILWDIDLGSPVIAVYTISKGGLLSIPFTSVADSTLKQLLKKISVKPSEIKFFPTLYIGEHSHGLYALPSLVDSSTPTITSKAGKLLLEGPIIPELGKNSIPSPAYEEILENESDSQTINSNNNNNIIILGHYEVPAEYKPHNQPLQITGRSDPVINSKNIYNATKKIDVKIDDTQLNKSVNDKKGWRKALIVLHDNCRKWLNQQGNEAFMLAIIILIGSLIAMFWYFNYQVREVRLHQMSQQLDQSSRESSRTDSNGKNGIIHTPVEYDEGFVRVGKITFDIEKVLGEGCEGTFVFEGKFEDRSVAVKRLLPGCFTFADREVALLRESDAHANVVRYFCTEQDRQFRYIALELAEATLQDYVEGRYDQNKISSKKILRQATSGLAHLHSLDIVHRDIKPHNVLLSAPGRRGQVRAMISDFGLCKKLQVGRMSLSRRSGLTGTMGWIAPEMLNNERTTCAVDIFSLGCVFFYVLSRGKHPFGEGHYRQTNILGDNFDLSSLQNIPENDKQVALVLITAMINHDPEKRPPAQAIHDYPMFWNASQVLTFFQDVSDRVEKDEPDSPALQALEKSNLRIVRSDWRAHIDNEVAKDLRKYRSYRGESVRDLLRALRNKKHHYRELTIEAQQSLGEMPTKFTDYWLTRFPLLLIHSWCALQDFRLESTFRCYYDRSYTFKVVNNETDASKEDKEIVAKSLQELERLNQLSRSPQEDNLAVDWSPNRQKVRDRRRKKFEQDKRKARSAENGSNVPSTLTSPSR